MRRSRVAIFSILGILSVVAIALVILLSVDLGRYKGFTERLVSNAIGRSFEIRGNFKLELGRKILLVAEDVHLAGPEWSADRDFVSVGHIDSTIDAMSFFGGPIVIESLNVSETKLNLEKGADGKSNWTFGPDTLDPVKRPTDAGKTGLDTLPVVIHASDIRDFRLSYSDPSMAQPLVVTVEHLSENVSDHGQVDVSVKGLLNQTPYSLVASVTELRNLVELQNVSSLLKGELGEIGFSGSANLDFLLAPKRPTIKLQVEGPNAEYLTDIIGIDRITTGPLNLDASVSPGSENVELAVVGRFGGFSIDANGHIVDFGNFDEIFVQAKASGPNAATAGKILGNDNFPHEPYQFEVDARISGSNIQLNPLHLEIGDTKLDASASIADFPSPDGASAKVQVSGPDFGKFNKLLGLPGKLTGPFSLDANVTALPDKKADVSLNAKAHDLSLALSGTWVDAPGFAGTTLDVTASGPRFDTVMKTLGLEKSPGDAFELQLSLEKAQSASNITNGRFRIGSDNLKISGQVGDKPLRNDTDLKFEFGGPNFRRTLRSFGAKADRLPATEWSARGGLQWDDGQLVLEQIHTVIGTNREYLIDVESRITEDPSYIGSTARVSFAGAEFGAVAEVGGILKLPDAKFHVTGDIERVANGFSIADGNVQLGDDRITINGLIGERPLRQGTDVTVKLSISEFRETLASFGLPVDNVPPGPLTAGGRLVSQGDVFALRNVRAETSDAILTASGQLGAFPELIGTEVDLDISGKDLSRLLPANEAFRVTTESFSLKSKFQVSSDDVSLAGLDAQFDQARLKGSASVSREPFLEQGKFEVQSETPDFGLFLQRYSDRIKKSGVPMTLVAAGHWEHNFWHFDNFLLTLGEGRLAIQGSLDGHPGFDRTNLAVDLHVANVRNLSPLAGRELPEHTANLHAQLTGTADKMTLREFGATLGDSDIDGEFSLRGGEIPTADIKMVSKHLDLRGYLPPQQEAVKAPASPPKDRVLPSTPLNLDFMGRLNANVDIHVDELLLPNSTSRNIVLVGSLLDRVARVTEFKLTGAKGGSMSGALVLKDTGSGADVALNVTGSNLSLGLPAASPDELQGLPQYDVDTALKGAGSSVAQLAGSLDGFLRITMGPGKVRASAMSMFTQDFLSQLLDTVNPFAKTDPYTNVKCAVLLVEANDGNLAGDPALVVQTDKINIFAEADIKLKTEKLSVGVNTVPQTGLGLSLSNLITPLTQVGGTLAKPTLTLNAEGAIIQGGAAVATAGISFLATRFKDRYLSAKDACGKAIDDKRDEFAKLQEQYSIANP